MNFDRQTLRELAHLSDEIGVLSVYVSVDEREPERLLPVAEARVRADLEALIEEVRATAPRGHARALTERVDALGFDLEGLFTARTVGGGIGRALLAPVSRDDLRTVTSQRPLGNRVVFEPTAYVRPLVAAWSLDGPAGIAVVSEEGLRLVDLRLGFAEDVASYPYTEEGERRELRGPAAANPALAQQSVVQTDLAERRQREHVARFLSARSAAVSELAVSKEWDYLAVSGDPELVAAVTSGLPVVWPVTVLRLSYMLSAATPREVAEAVRPDLERARQERGRALAGQVRDAALSGATGALGLSETLATLQEGRVAHLLLDESQSWQGSRSPEGYLVANGGTPPWVDPDELIDEPELAERMIEKALDTDAEVTLLDPAAATPLADFDGVGAQLRW